jgi:hypothetical protein
MPIRRRLRLAAPALLLAAACGDAPAAPATPADVFDEAWRLLDRHYAFFEEFGIDWGAARARHGAGLGADASEARLRAAVCGLVDELRSYHAGLTTPAGVCSWASAPRYPAGYSAALVQGAVGTLRATASGRIRWGRVADAGGLAIGYVRVASFEGDGWGGEIDEALAALPDARALVVDVRANPGGNEGNARGVAARFADRERPYRLARFRSGPRHDAFGPPQEMRVAPLGRRFAGPVAVLTDRGDHSAAEDFVMMMRVLPGVVVVGDTTFGTSSNPRTETLANGWALRIPQSVQTTPGGLVVEGRGLPPGVAARLDPADAARGVDTILRAAVAELRRRLGA